MFNGLLRDEPAVLEHAYALRRMADKQPVWSGLANVYTGQALMIQGNWDEGVGYLRKGIAFHEVIGLLGMRPWQKLDEVEYLASQGQIDDALALVADAVADTELIHLKSPALRQRANLLVQSGADAQLVDAAYRAAIECPRSQGARYFELQATTDFARWLESQDRASEARTILAEIYNWFTEGFDTFALMEAKALLDELSAGTGRLCSR